MIQPSRPEDRGGRLRNIEPDFAAIIAPGLRCAFEDRQRVRLEGRTPGVHEVFAKLQPLLGDTDAQKALGILRRDFLDPEMVGPLRVAAFMTGGRDEDLQADVVGFVSELLAKLAKP